MFWMNIVIFLIFTQSSLTTFKCPKFTCDTLGKGECIKKSYDKDKSERTIIVHSCEEPRTICQVDIDYNFSNQTDDSSNFCISEDDLFPKKAKYPGEPCDSITNCINGPCPEDGVCQSVLQGEKCETHLDCSVRNYCDPEEKVCKQVKIHKEPCTSDYECKNSHGCHNGICFDYFSLPVGTDLTNSTSDNPEKLCVTETIQDGKCYGLFYDPQMKPDMNGMVECNFSSEDECKYIDSNNRTFTEQCQCGLNKEGKGYCRRAFDGSKGGDWEKLSIRKRHILLNKCHTLNRFDCRSMKKVMKDRLMEIQLRTIYAHKLFYSEDCVRKVFSSSSYAMLHVLYIVLILVYSLI